jgi:hypothetical protein
MEGQSDPAGPCSPERWRRVEQLLDASLEVPPAERRALLDAACPDDPDMRAEVERLLRACAESAAFLQVPAVEFAAPMLSELATGATGGEPADPLPPLPPLAPGTRIGAYRIIGEAGRGGMAVVYLAERADGEFRKRVALKVVRSGLPLQDDLVRRFREERQILASLEHPGIARLFDGGVTEEGLPWFAMEYFPGTPLTQYCDDRQLDTSARLELFRDVCDAVQYAHDRQIVHRDIKPGNILVMPPAATGSARPQVRLLDFGIAKLLAADPARAGAELTRAGERFMTPKYASPEQARGDPVTPASDVYALGVVLHNLRCTDGGSALDEVVRKAMNPEPTGRYSTAGALGEAVPRNLHGLLGAAAAQRAAGGPQRATTALPRRTLAAAAGAGLVILAGAAWLATTSLPESSPAPGRVVVAPLENRTGQPLLDPVGIWAAEWIIQGLSHTGLIEVVPMMATLAATRYVDNVPADSEGVARFRLLAQETGAVILVSGAFYQQADSLYLHVSVTDAHRNRVLHALQPVAASLDLPLAGIEELRMRLMGVLAPHFNPRTQHHTAASGAAAPSFDAYRAHAAGMELFVSGDFRAAHASLIDAAARDSFFTVPLLYAAISLENVGDYVGADSILARLRPRQHLLPEFERIGFAMLDASLRGDHAAYYRAHLRAPVVAPGTLAHWGLANAALRVNRPAEAIRTMRALDPTRGELRGWASYWITLSQARHRLGQYRAELAVAGRARELLADDPRVTGMQISALAGMRRIHELNSLLAKQTERGPAPATLLRHAGLELRAHGAQADGAALLQASLEALLARPRDDPGYRAALARAHYLVGDWDAAGVLLRDLAEEQPANLGHRGALGALAARRGETMDARAASRWLADLDVPYLVGANTLWRARIASLLGEPEEAVSLLGQAWREGAFLWEMLHLEPDFDPVRIHPAFRAFVRPRD